MRPRRAATETTPTPTSSASPLVATALLALAAVAVAIAAAGCAGRKPPTPTPATTPAKPEAKDSPAAIRARHWIPVLDAPRATEGGHVAWSRATRTVSPEVATVRRRLEERDTTGAWSAALESPSLAAYAWRQSARAAMARADTAQADAAWARLSSLESPWAWEGLRQRVDLAVAGGREARADSLLAAADRDGWPDLDRAAWLSRRARLAASLGDTARALDLGRQLLKRYPATPPAAATVTWLETLLTARGQRPSLDDAVDMAEVAALNGNRKAAAERLDAVRRQAPADRKNAIALRAGELWRLDRNYAASRRSLHAALAAAPNPDERGRVLLEMARVDRDAGASAAGLENFRKALATSRAPARRATVAWEYALELDATGRGTSARAAYRVVVEAGGARAADARLRAALTWLVEGRADSARAWLDGATDDAGRFWRATLRPPSEAPTAKSELSGVAARPGYGFYAVAARETLAVRGWTGAVAKDGCAHREACAPLDRALDLGAVGATDDAMTVLARWAAAASGDARLAEVAAAPVGADPAAEDSAASAGAATSAPGEATGLSPALLRGARVAYAVGRIPAGIRLAQRALEAGEAAAAWSVAPWMYPPAFDSLYRAAEPLIAEAGLKPELVRAIAWQESRFDPQARSRSNALGLYQLKLPTAGDVARWLGEPPPTEARLFDPARSIRYGIAYLEWLHERFDGHDLVAVAAYNAGPSGLSPNWRRDLERGGVALFCERIGRYETRDYVRRVMAARAAYRELNPVIE